jgi:hypothetical protein
MRASFTTRFIRPTQISWPDLVNCIGSKGEYMPKIPASTCPAILYPGIPDVACICTLIIPSPETHALHGIRISRRLLKFVGNHRESLVFMGILMKLDGIRVNYLGPILLPHTIPPAQTYATL